MTQRNQPAADEDLLIVVQGSVLDSEEGIRFRGYTVCIISLFLVGIITYSWLHRSPNARSCYPRLPVARSLFPKVQLIP